MRLLKCLPFLLCFCCAYAEEITIEDVERYRELAEQGDADGQLNLGHCYAFGWGVPEDDTEAVKWYRMAAEQGHAIGQLNLGLRYANGEGVPEDDVTAYMWLNLASAQGYPLAMPEKSELTERMTREQIAEGQKMSREWLEKRENK
jgi:TPR repeat protein